MTDCPICLLPFEIDSQINKVTTECGHTFHCSCLMKNVAHNGFGCPYCRNIMAVKPGPNDNEDEYEDEESMSSEEAREDDILTSYRWFHRRLDEPLEPISRNDVVTYEIHVDDDGYYYEGEFDYWDGFKEGYMHPPYLFHKLSNNSRHDEDAVSYSDLALAYMSLKRRYDGIVPLQEGDYAYRQITDRCIPLYDSCTVYKNAETKVNKLVDQAIQCYYITDNS